MVKEKWLLKGVNVQTAGRNNWKMFLYFHALNPSDVWFLFDVIKSGFFFMFKAAGLFFSMGIVVNQEILHLFFSQTKISHF